MLSHQRGTLRSAALSTDQCPCCWSLEGEWAEDLRSNYFSTYCDCPLLLVDCCPPKMVAMDLSLSVTTTKFTADSDANGWSFCREDRCHSPYLLPNTNSDV